MKTIWVVILTAIITALIVGGGVYFYLNSKYQKQKTDLQTQNIELQAKLKLAEAATATPTATATAKTTTKSDEQLIKEAFAKEHSGTSFDITVSKISGNYAQGGAIESGAEVGGGWFLAAKKNGVWVIVDEGNGTVSCEKIEGYDFPAEMVPECWSESQGKSIKR